MRNCGNASDFLKEILSKEESWDRLRKTDKPVCIYGMGDACERILEQFDKRSIKCSAIFASDDFVRGQDFCGYKIERLSELEKRYGELCVCPAFGSDRPGVMRKIKTLALRHELIFPDLPVTGDRLFSKPEFIGRFGEFEKAFQLLCDDRSKECFKRLFEFKITGDINAINKAFCDSDKEIKSLADFSEAEVFADLGAYDGDTALKFIEAAGGKFERIYAFEPDIRSFRKLVKRLSGFDGISFINACAWKENTVLKFSQNSGRQSKITGSGSAAAAKTLDSAVNGGKCGMIKYDVEGAEREAIAGSQKTIEKNRPVLIVSAYHRAFDAIELILLIHKLFPFYRLYFRQPPYYPAWDGVIIAKDERF